ncbi:MAG: hypothetical protein U0989_05635 [Azonexus sp.]|nr:hypothetical protein [Azonexus sp.]
MALQPEATLGNAICTALRGQVEKLGPSIGEEPIWAEATFAETVDPFSQEINLIGIWSGKQRYGTVTIFPNERKYIEGEGILMRLNKVGIAGSSGSLEPSHVMRAMGIPYTAAHGTIRFSPSRYNTETEIDRVIKVVPPIVAQLRKLSPYWSDVAGKSGPVANPETAFAPTYA